jgi:hypothetical protein
LAVTEGRRTAWKSILIDGLAKNLLDWLKLQRFIISRCNMPRQKMIPD